MIALNYADDIEEMSEEARELARRGVVVTRLLQHGTARTLYISTRLAFEEARALCDWYVAEKFGGRIISANVGDYVAKGRIGFTFIGPA